MTRSMDDTRRPASYQASLAAASMTVVDPDSIPNTPQSPEFTKVNCADKTNDMVRNMNQVGHASGQPWPEKPVQGWPQLALQMAKTPDFAAFKRYRELNVKSLLYYQAELDNIGQKLHDMEWQNHSIDKLWAERADEFVESKSAQFQLVKDMRVILKEYNDALLQFSKICSLPDPEPFNMRTLRDWLRNEDGADLKVRNRKGHAHTPWGNVRKNPDANAPGLWMRFAGVIWSLFWGPSEPEENLDLAVTTPETKVDGLTKWIAAEFIPWKRALCQYWREKWGGENDVEKRTPTFNFEKESEKESEKKSEQEPETDTKKETLVSWSEKSALRVTSTISTVVACLLPVIAIAILSQLHGLGKLLGCLAGFAGLFSLVLISLTQGTSTRTEIFAATAAFSAVMVVFISQPPPPVVTVVPGSSMPSIFPSATPTLL